jgi:hypothetical protein
MGGVMTFVLPENLADSVRSDHSPRRDAWLAALPRLVDEISARWSLTVGPPFQPGGRSAWVAPARDRAGRDLVLKLAWQHDEARDEAAGLRAWHGDGAVRLHAEATAEATSVLLLERCRPGTPLAAALPEAEQDAIVAGLLKQLWQAPADPAVFRPLQVMADAWATEFQQRLTANLRRYRTTVRSRCRLRAAEFLTCGSQGRSGRRAPILVRLTLRIRWVMRLGWPPASACCGPAPRSRHPTAGSGRSCRPTSTWSSARALPRCGRPAAGPAAWAVN